MSQTSDTLRFRSALVTISSKFRAAGIERKDSRETVVARPFVATSIDNGLDIVFSEVATFVMLN